MNIRRNGRVLITLAACCLANPTTHAADWPDSLSLFVESNCYECHSGESASGGLDLKALSIDLNHHDVERVWTLVHDRIAAGEMPPAEANQPSAGERGKALQLLSRRLTAIDLASREVVLRRLNRVEYQNTVRDLFGIYVDLSELLPEDALAQGFDNIGESLSVSAEQMQVYLDVADIVLDAAFGPPEKPATIRQTVNLKDIVQRDAQPNIRFVDDGVVLFNSG